MGSALIVAAILVLMGPKKMMHIVIVCLLAYAFPYHAVLAGSIFGIGYYAYKKYNPFK